METEHTAHSRIPQLRIVLNTSCGKRCIYCRPSGEASHGVPCEQQATPEELLGWVRALVDAGIRDVRLTGGEPALYPSGGLVELVREIKGMGVPRLSLVTRNGRIGQVLPALADAGLACITFSLDTLDPVRWCHVCGLSESRRGEHGQLLEAARFARQLGLPVSFNCVLMAETSTFEVMDLLVFAAELEASVKFEELIRDVGSAGHPAGEQLHVGPEFFAHDIREQSIESWITCPPGGLGHPMENHRLSSGVTVTWKQFAKGACYGDACRSCSAFPCDDALMALRLLPDGRLQTCLKRDDNLHDLRGAMCENTCAADEVVKKALGVFATVTRYDHAEIEKLRERRACTPAPQVSLPTEVEV